MFIKEFLQRKIFNLIAIYTKKKISNFSDGKIESLLRSKIHVIEKELMEEEIDSQNMMYARLFFSEAQKRSLLSQDEINWCKRVLFGFIQQDNKNSFRKKERDLFKNILRHRRSIRKWKKGSRIGKEEFEQLIDAARWAPSSCNRQPWHFLLTHNKEKIEFLAKIRKQLFIKNAPSCILVLINLEAYDEITKHYFAYLDAGAAIQNMLLMIENINLGACFVNFAPGKDSEFQKKQIVQKFNIPLNLELVGIIPIGKSDEAPSPPGRKDVSRIIHFETF